MKRLLVTLVAAGLVLTACGDDDTDEASTCESAEALSASVQSLFAVDVVSEGTSGVEAALDDVESAWDQLSEDADGQFSQELDDVKSAVNDAVDAVKTADQAGSLEAGVTQVTDAFQQVATALQSLDDEIESEFSDCDLSTPSPS